MSPSFKSKVDVANTTKRAMTEIATTVVMPLPICMHTPAPNACPTVDPRADPARPKPNTRTAEAPA